MIVLGIIVWIVFGFITGYVVFALKRWSGKATWDDYAWGIGTGILWPVTCLVVAGYTIWFFTLGPGRSRPIQR